MKFGPNIPNLSREIEGSVVRLTMDRFDRSGWRHGTQRIRGNRTAYGRRLSGIVSPSNCGPLICRFLRFSDHVSDDEPRWCRYLLVSSLDKIHTGRSGLTESSRGVGNPIIVLPGLFVLASSLPEKGHQSTECTLFVDLATGGLFFFPPVGLVGAA